MHIKKMMVSVKLFENTKNYKSAYPGSNKVVYGPVNIWRKKFQNLIFEYAKVDFNNKKIASAKKNQFFWLRFYVSQKKRLDETRTENQIKYF